MDHLNIHLARKNITVFVMIHETSFGCSEIKDKNDYYYLGFSVQSTAIYYPYMCKAQLHANQDK